MKDWILPATGFLGFTVLVAWYLGDKVIKYFRKK